MSKSLERGNIYLHFREINVFFKTQAYIYKSIYDEVKDKKLAHIF